MTTTDSELRVWNEIQEWQQQLFQYEPTDFEMTYDKWMERSFEKLSPKVKEQFFNNIDNWLFHLNAFLQGTQSQIDARRRIISEARIFDQNINELEDLRHLSIDQLIFLADQQIAKHRLYSFAQGGLTGTGGLLLLGADIPAMTVINLRSIQLIGMTYGYDVNIPYELMISLKLFHLATLPKRLQAEAWELLVNEVIDDREHYYLYEGAEELTDQTWLQQPMKQLIKSLVIVVFRKKIIQGLPLIGMAIGAGMNYQMTRQVTEMAHRFYQLRYLSEKSNGLENGLF